MLSSKCYCLHLSPALPSSNGLLEVPATLFGYNEYIKEEELAFIPHFPPHYGSIKATYNSLPFLSPQQTSYGYMG